MTQGNPQCLIICCLMTILQINQAPLVMTQPTGVSLADLKISLKVELEEYIPESWEEAMFLWSPFSDLCKLALVSVEALIVETSRDWCTWSTYTPSPGSDRVRQWNDLFGVEALVESIIFNWYDINWLWLHPKTLNTDDHFKMNLLPHR